LFWLPSLCLPGLPCPALPHPSPSLLQVGEAEKELGGAAATNPFAQLVDEAEGLDKIEDLQVGGGVGGWVGGCCIWKCLCS
jgi:hypothetical protein